MKASIYRKYGQANVLEVTETVLPVLKSKEILIKVHAATVNRTDCAMLKGKPFIMRLFLGLFKPKNPILGTDFAGVVEKTGKDALNFKIGDRVFGFDDSGISSHAEYMKINEANAVATIPNNVSFEQAAASIEGAHYAYNFINKVKIEKGQKILVNGATGAIGSAAVQLLKNLETEVTAVCRGNHEEIVKSIGAAKVIDYEKEDFTKSNEVYHFVFDAVGKNSFGHCKKVLAPKGVYISSELGRMGQNIFFSIFTPIFGKKKVAFPIPKNRKESVLEMKKLLEEESFDPIIDKSYKLDNIADAFRYVLKGQKIGNVIITQNQEMG